MNEQQTWLLIDVSALAYQSMHVVGDMSYQGVATGALYGMFRSVLDLQDLFGTSLVVWCFDRGYGKRLEICRSYKHRRYSDDDDEAREARRVMRQQLYRLRVRYLPDLGVQNVLAQDDYEADDVIASVCQNLEPNQSAVVVSGDEDLYQLLGPRVTVWQPRKKRSVTADSFRAEYGIDPSLWADVKAIAGCSSDNVIGVRGVGEKTAIKFLSGQLKDTSRLYQAIVDGNDLWRRNLQLVRLPFPGIEQFKLVDDGGMDEGRWNTILEQLGMRSLTGRPPRRRGLGVL